jgi:hypothetical protein
MVAFALVLQFSFAPGMLLVDEEWGSEDFVRDPPMYQLAAILPSCPSSMVEVGTVAAERRR